MTNTKKYTFSYHEFENDSLLNAGDKLLLSKAREITAKAYAPYSDFFVGAAASLSNKKIITATNQENASFPAGICAERVLLSAITSVYGEVVVDTIAISYINRRNNKSNHPISPCGICRQSLMEYQQRVKHPIRLILAGMNGKIVIIDDASFLLPLNFNGDDMM
ncbi:cytidine deaminase [Parafilimonas terrae]|uniref:Cytidine deaminase n=1 Tax=Parafilimonas terrae TaxID=1465490 RepID=A0A1I5S6S4_9BACT|nr:cytidine deaminase [Parafilimonas terrae]SFP66371.1 cytidine deaminase [Parafilimonas terrae]